MALAAAMNLKTGLVPYDYQRPLVDKIWTLSSQEKPVVLAAGCGAGKTFMSIYHIERYLKENPTAKVLVLAHGQTGLRTQYDEEVTKHNPDFTHTVLEVGADLDAAYRDYQVIIAIPQSIKLSSLKKFDVLVVDEAHQFYFADKVQAIIKIITPSHQLLLTGTPSPFIYANSQKKGSFHIEALSMGALLEAGAITDILVEVASTVYPLDYDDYLPSGDVRGSFRFKAADTQTTLDEVLYKLIQRMTAIFKNKPTVTSLVPGWLSVLQTLKKTMIVCHNQQQAKQVERCLTKKGVNVALSTSDWDTNSVEIKRFKKKDDCLVLIVVGRGVLGFNYPKLVNVVDMTVSRHLDRILQLMARVSRHHPNGDRKIFLKVVPHTMAQYFEHIMTAVLCLTSDEWYLKYNGKNSLTLPLPAVGEKIKRRGRGTGKRGKHKITTPIQYAGLPAIQFFHSLYHKDNAVLNSYAWTTLGRVRQALHGITTYSNYDTEFFIEQARAVHGDRYDYSEVEYTTSREKVKIICKTHGMFEQGAHSHLAGAGCPHCGGSAKSNTKNFIKKARAVHGDRYDYSEVEYTGSIEKVKIICKTHGVFKQKPRYHLQGKGCIQCGGRGKSNTKNFIKKARAVHGDRYDYSEVVYIKNSEQIEIICKTHGSFKQTPGNHLTGRGCPHSASTAKSNTKNFIKKTKAVHGDRYDYSEVEYTGSREKVKIICKTHGVFKQQANSHLEGKGCPYCAREECKMNTKSFIKKARAVHGDRYDYSEVEYTGSIEKVKIICKTHGVFKQQASSHLQGKGCPPCAKEAKRRA